MKSSEEMIVESLKPVQHELSSFDKIDQRILSDLQMDGRMTNVDLAKRGYFRTSLFASVRNLKRPVWSFRIMPMLTKLALGYPNGFYNDQVEFCRRRRIASFWRPIGKMGVGSRGLCYDRWWKWFSVENCGRDWDDYQDSWLITFWKKSECCVREIVSFD